MTAMERLDVLERQVVELKRRVDEIERQLAAVYATGHRPFDWERQPTSGDPLPPYPVNIT